MPRISIGGIKGDTMITEPTVKEAGCEERRGVGNEISSAFVPLTEERMRRRSQWLSSPFLSPFQASFGERS